jgi:hypothetical protein
MVSATTSRERVQRAREQFEEWTFDARDRAYAELFEGADPVLTDEELQLLDRIDSALTRQNGRGLWGTDEYGTVAGDALGAAQPRVVCTYHSEIPSEGFRGEKSLGEATREELNGALWDYCERVAAIVQSDLDAFLGATSREEE